MIFFALWFVLFVIFAGVLWLFLTIQEMNACTHSNEKHLDKWA